MRDYASSSAAWWDVSVSMSYTSYARFKAVARERGVTMRALVFEGVEDVCRAWRPADRLVFDSWFERDWDLRELVEVRRFRVRFDEAHMRMLADLCCRLRLVPSHVLLLVVLGTPADKEGRKPSASVSSGVGSGWEVS